MASPAEARVGVLTQKLGAIDLVGSMKTDLQHEKLTHCQSHGDSPVVADASPGRSSNATSDPLEETTANRLQTTRNPLETTSDPAPLPTDQKISPPAVRPFRLLTPTLFP
jgi:hypothetical protein